MTKRVLLCFALLLLSSVATMAQQASMQPLTFWYEYAVNPGKEDQFLELVKTVGAPVRDKLMADGVVLAWGVQTPLLRVPGNATHVIWYAVADWSGVEKVQSAMQAQIAKLNDEAAKGSVAKKGASASQSPTARMMEIGDVSKTHDYLTRDLVFSVSQTPPPAGLLPYTRYNFTKVKPGKGPEYRKAWEKYNKPILDKLLADGVIGAYGLAVEEVRTSGEFTHFTWYDVANLGQLDKIRTAFLADRDHRSQEEQNAIDELFAALTDPDAARSEVDHAIIFKVAPMK
jgi:hypothetical protein